MEMAAIRPAATARTARSAPRTASPPAKTPGRFVASVRVSTAMPRPLICEPLALGPCAVDRLADRRDHGVASDLELRLRDRDGTPSPERVRLAQLHALAHQRPGVAVAARLETHRRHQELERDTLRLGALDLVHQARHLAPRAPVEHADLGAEAARACGRSPSRCCRRRSRPRCRPSAGRSPSAIAAQELDPRERQLLALAAQARRVLRADAEEDRVVVAPQVGEREVASPAACSCGTRRPAARSTSDLGVERRSRQAVLGDAVAQHAARERVGVEERAGVTLLAAGRRRRSALPAPRRRSRRCFPVGAPGAGASGSAACWLRSAGVAVQRADRQPLVVVVAAAAALLAQPRAHAPERAGQRQPLVDALHRPVVLVARDLVDEPRHVEPRRTAGGAGSRCTRPRGRRAAARAPCAARRGCRRSA